MFFRKYPVPEATLDWLEESFHWAIDNGFLGAKTPLITPTRDYFTAPRGNSPEIVRQLVSDITRLMGMPEQNIEVLPLDRLRPEYRHSYQAISETGGTWQGSDGQSLIRYDPEMANRPVPFIATLVHEVMHHRLHDLADDMPGGAEAEELNTDLHCITCGFGMLQLAGAEATGWQGYMRQETRAHALAMFVQLREVDPTVLKAWLPPRSLSAVKGALTYLGKHPGPIADLRQKLLGGGE
ncbi:MAG: hypothetical protein ACRC14_04310 [Paracoccaceae bacterium]